MINNEKFAKRLKKILEYYQLSSAAFADEIGVQRSSISHLLSGRNKPSLDFVLKVLDTYKEVELYWLLNGKGTFPAERKTNQKIIDKNHSPNPKEENLEKQIDRIIIFYNDGTFENYIP